MKPTNNATTDETLLDDPAEESAKTPQVEATEPEPDATEVEPKSDAVEDTPDYSWVPKKYMKNGEPDFQALAKSYQSLEKKLGQKGPQAAETIEDYTYEPSVLDENGKPAVITDPTADKAFKEEALKAGMTVDQYKFVMGKYEQVVETLTMTPAKAAEALQADWGKDYAAQLANAKAAFDEYAPSDVDINDVGNNVAVIKLLASIGSQMGEDKVAAKGKTKAVDNSMSIDDVRKIMADKDYSTNAKKQKMVSDFFEANYKE
jgi:hypothetical protein